MARFKVYHIDRDGHVQRDIFHAKTRREALEEAKERYDDVIKVKRDNHLPSGLVFLIVVGVVVLLFVLAN